MLGGLLCFMYGKEVLAFSGGSYEEFMEFQSSYSMYFEMIEYAINNGYDYYNFYGISSDLNSTFSYFFFFVIVFSKDEPCSMILFLGLSNSLIILFGE